jgi:hypothetical protein
MLDQKVTGICPTDGMALLAELGLLRADEMAVQ